MRNFILLAALAIVASGCGAYTFGPAANPTPSPAGTTVTATEKDHAVTLHPGQTLEVVLHAGNNMTPWTHPVSNDPTVLSPIVDTAATAALGVTLAAFQAKRSGSAQVTATAGPKCPPNAMCPMYAVAYMLAVTVTP